MPLVDQAKELNISPKPRVFKGSFAEDQLGANLLLLEDVNSIKSIWLKYVALPTSILQNPNFSR